MIRVVGVRETLDGRVPAGGGHRDPKMVENRAAAQKDFAPRAIGGQDYPHTVGEQVKPRTVESPPPGLGVVQ
jgi:hypothetical protein